MTPKFSIEEDWSGWALRDNAPNIVDIGECIADGMDGDVEEGWLELFSYDPADGPLKMSELIDGIGGTLDPDDLKAALDFLQQEGKVAVTATAADEDDGFGPGQTFAKLAALTLEKSFDDPETKYDLAGLAADSDADRIAAGVLTEAEAVLAMLVWIALDGESDSEDTDIAAALSGAAHYLDSRDIKWTSGR